MHHKFHHTLENFAEADVARLGFSDLTVDVVIDCEVSERVVMFYSYEIENVRICPLGVKSEGWQSLQLIACTDAISEVVARCPELNFGSRDNEAWEAEHGQQILEALGEEERQREEAYRWGDTPNRPLPKDVF